MLRVGFNLLLAASVIFSSQALAETQLFKPLAEAKVDEKANRHFSHYPLIIGLDKSKYLTEQVSGKLSRISYELPVSFEPIHVVNNYKTQITKLRGTLLFECKGKECGKKDKLQKQIRPLNTIPKNQPALLTAKLTLDKKQLYLSLYAASWHNGTSLQLDTVEVIPEPLDLIEVNQAYLGSEIAQTQFKDRSNKDERNSKDHPMIKRLPGAYITDYEQYDFGQTKVITGINKKKHQVKTLEGRITDISYDLPRNYSEYEVNANYKVALTQLGFTPLFNCQGKECGGKSKVYQNIKTLAHIGRDESQFYSLYRLERPQGNVYAMTYIIGFEDGLWGEIKLIEETQLIDDRVAIDLEGLTDKMAETGHVALDGLLFEFDSDKMLPEAKAVVKVVASYLKSHPKQRFYVIGHTDDQGKQSYNQLLSDKRAKAVVKQLTTAHKIPKDQLTGKGVGEYSPVANNSNEAGQKLNRRVELVLRSDQQ
ncbi:OmpA family protein [Shewanella woodyi]|uniref:OmpA family protein n=1 Tax=Shewanella woodyi TaxID=60961 RepID=UPI0007F92DAF|nr:OmpA family protein [Shewanella woodyi]